MPKPPAYPSYQHCSCFSCFLSLISYSLELPTVQYSFIQLLNYIPLSPQDSLFSTLTCSSPLRLPLLDFHRNDSWHLLLLVRGVTDGHLNVTEIDVNFILLFFYINKENTYLLTCTPQRFQYLLTLFSGASFQILNVDQVDAIF